MKASMAIGADKPIDIANLARDIQSQCRQWFDAHPTGIRVSRTGIQHPIAVSILLTELSLVEVHLNGDSFLKPTELLEEQKNGSQLRGDVITSIEQMIQAHPQLEAQLRPDLDYLWANYLPQMGAT